VDLERGVGPLQADVVGDQLQGVGPVDPDAERLLAQPADAVVERPVAGRVRESGQPEVVGPQGGQDPHHHHPAVVPGGGPADDGQGLLQLAGEGGERPAGQRRRGQVQLQVEAVDLQHHPRVGGLVAHRLVAGQGPPLAVDQEQLQLGPDGGRPGPEAGTLQHPLQGRQALVQAPREPLVLQGVELLTVDGKAHVGADASRRAPARRRAERPGRRGAERP
jgi:hypothetical protein